MNYFYNKRLVIQDNTLNKITDYIIIKFKSLFGFGEGHERTKRAKKNIGASFLLKGSNIIIGLMLVPLTVNYLEPTRYGIWITLSSIVGWFGFFDIGLGHGLRNRFAESLAKRDHELARVYVSTTYAILTIIISSILLVFYLVNPFIDWNRVLNADVSIVQASELSLLALIVFTFFCLRFVFKLITTILTADQRPAFASAFDLGGKVWALVIIYILTKTTQGNLVYVGLAISSTPVLVLIISSITFFKKRYKRYRPALSYIDLKKAPDLLHLGIKFFIIQIAAVLLYQTNNIIISQLFGPKEVTPYNIAFKYFSVLMMGFSILVVPFWSAFTEAWAKKEIDWIKKIVNKLIYLWLALVFLAMIMLVFSNFVYKNWIGDNITIPYTMSALIVAWVLLNSWNIIFSHFLNGVGKVKFQLYLGIIAALLNIPLAITLGKHMGIEGILVSNLFLALISAVIYPLQYKYIIEGKAKGIFNE